MKAWTGDDNWDDELWIGHHETDGQARRAYANDVGCDFVEARVRRCPAMDDIRLSARNMLMTGTCAWYDCQGCSRRIHCDGLEEGAPLIENNWDRPEPVPPLVSDRWGRLWCELACYEKWFRKWGADDPLLRAAALIELNRGR